MKGIIEFIGYNGNPCFIFANKISGFCMDNKDNSRTAVWIDGEEWIFAEPISSVKEKIELKMKMED